MNVVEAITMIFKGIQINIYRGKFLDKLVEFLRVEKPDVVTMQEVSSGRVNFWPDQSIDTFQYIKDALNIEGALAPIYYLSGDPTAYEGNAVLVRGEILETKVVWLKEYREYEYVPQENEGPEIPRNALDMAVDFNGTVIHVLATHGAWTKDPVDTPEKMRQVRQLAEYIRSLGDEPFVLGGDFNMESGSEVIKTIDAVAHNAVYDSSIKNTLNLRIHRAAANLGRGRLVDFIYTSPHFIVECVEVADVDVSDHLPVRAILKIS